MAARYKKATAALDETARARLWERGGAEPVADRSDLPELADLVDSFYGDGVEAGRGEMGLDREKGRGRDSLEDLLSESGLDPVARRIRRVVEEAVAIFGCLRFGELNRRVLTRLREIGFDAGICKSYFEGPTERPAIYHEYIDVITSGDGEGRFIVELNLSGEFEIARPTAAYRSELNKLPKVFVGRPEMLQKVVKRMCGATKKSMKSMQMHVPPWRRMEFMQAKWSGRFKRVVTRKEAVESGVGAPAPDFRLGRSSGRRFCRVELRSRPGSERMGVALEGWY